MRNINIILSCIPNTTNVASPYTDSSALHRVLDAARRIIPVRTLHNWEQGGRGPPPIKGTEPKQIRRIRNNIPAKNLQKQVRTLNKAMLLVSCAAFAGAVRHGEVVPIARTGKDRFTVNFQLRKIFQALAR